jgi:hypothetical protein
LPKGKNSLELPQFDFDKLPLLLNQKQAALEIGVSESYLKMARSTGRKEGRTPAPDFCRVDGKIRYHRDILKKWVTNLEQRQAV